MAIGACWSARLPTAIKKDGGKEEKQLVRTRSRTLYKKQRAAGGGYLHSRASRPEETSAAQFEVLEQQMHRF
jgi:hypothetical protein